MTDPIGTDALLDRIEELESENEKLRKGLELYSPKVKHNPLLPKWLRILLGLK